MEKILITTEDRKEIAADHYQSPDPAAPTIILIPDARCDRELYGTFPLKLNRNGFNVLSMDLRYKPLMVGAKGLVEMIQLLRKEDLYAPVNYDLKSALDFLVAQGGINPDRISLMGASYGSRVALHGSVKYRLKGLVLLSLSGQTALPGKSVQELLMEYGDNPILFMTSEKDWGGNHKAPEDNRRYRDWAKGKKELKIWPGSFHGGELLTIEESADFTIDWLKENL